MDKVLKNGCFIALLLSIATFSAYAQREYKGKVIDAETNEPIPYVNIGIVEKSIGTVSDEEGLFSFHLNNDEVKPSAKVLFSALGYTTLNIPIDKMSLTYTELPIFKMKPSAVELQEVVVSNREGTFISDAVGYKNYGEQSFGYWKDNIALGGELATKINVKNGLRRLEKFQFEVFDNPSDSLLLRVNIYDNDGPLRGPKTNLNKSGDNILVTVKKTDKIVWVDLRPFDIYVQNDFILSLELLKLYGDKKLGLILVATANQYGSYRKYASQDKWERFSDQNMAFYLETQLMVSNETALRFEKKKKNRKKKERTISGFTILRGKMIAGVEIINNRTNEAVSTDDNGRYTIAAKKNDKVFFRKKGYQEMVLTVGDKSIVNVIMKTKPIEPVTSKN